MASPLSTAQLQTDNVMRPPVRYGWTTVCGYLIGCAKTAASEGTLFFCCLPCSCTNPGSIAILEIRRRAALVAQRENEELAAMDEGMPGEALHYVYVDSLLTVLCRSRCRL